MFEEFMGIPAHPLLVHAAVVFIPLQALFSIGYAFLPGLRSKIAWIAVTLSVVGPATAFVAKESGEAFEQRLINNGLKDAGLLSRIHEHSDFADNTFLATLALAVLTLVMAFLQRRASGDAAYTGGNVVISWILRILILVAAGVTAYFVYKTGDTGAHLVWTGQ